MITHRDGLEYTAESSGKASATIQPAQRDNLTITRLLVLIPAQGVHYSALAKRILALAKPCQIDVLLLGLAGSGSWHKTDMRLRLNTLNTMMCDDDVHTDTCVEPADDWVCTVKKYFQPGDAVICLAETVTNSYGGAWHPLSEVIEYFLDVPVYVVTNMVLPHSTRRIQAAPPIGKTLFRLDNVLTLALIVGCFFYIQVRINLMTVGLLRNSMLYASGLAEAGFLGAWSVIRH